MKDASVFLPSWDCSPVSFSFAKRSPWLFSAEGWIATTTGDLLSLLTELRQALTSFLTVLAAQIFVWLDLPTSLFLNLYFQHLSIKCSPIRRPFFLSPAAGSITSPSSLSEKIFCVSLGWETAETWPYQNVFVLLKEECIYLSKSLIQVHSLAGRNSEQGEGASVNPFYKQGSWASENLWLGSESDEKYENEALSSNHWLWTSFSLPPTPVPISISHQGPWSSSSPVSMLAGESPLQSALERGLGQRSLPSSPPKLDSNQALWILSMTKSVDETAHSIATPCVSLLFYEIKCSALAHQSFPISHLGDAP